LANKYTKVVGDDCLCQRTSPGTPVGEHIYCFCGCNVAEAYQAGLEKGLELAIDRVKYTRFSIVIQNDEYTRGYIDACKLIEKNIEELNS
jgi:hypothetical protein